MSIHRTLLRLATCCLCAVPAAATALRPAWGSDFTAFAEDEEVCRRVGTGAIKGGSGPAAAQRYDYAYRRCMFVHGRRRQMGEAADEGPPMRPDGSNNSQFPDAYYSVPYATPGYGYDGFSYRR